MLPVNDSLTIALQQRNQAMNFLLATYPKAFDLCDRRPLKSNILDDIYQQNIASQPSSTNIEQAFLYYTNWGSYLNALVNGGNCIDLDGNICGEVSRAAALKAKLQLEAAQKKISIK